MLKEALLTQANKQRSLSDPGSSILAPHYRVAHRFSLPVEVFRKAYPSRQSSCTTR
jgi:hypothetical protein